MCFQFPLNTTVFRHSVHLASHSGLVQGRLEMPVILVTLRQSDGLSPPASLHPHLLKSFTPFHAHLRGCFFYKLPPPIVWSWISSCPPWCILYYSMHKNPSCISLYYLCSCLTLTQSSLRAGLMFSSSLLPPYRLAHSILYRVHV